MMNLHFIDIETSGLDPNKHDVIEVGIVSTHHGKVERRTQFSLAFDPAYASPRALEVNGYGKRTFAPLLPDDEAFALVDDIFSDKGLFIAWHAHFDSSFMNAWYARANRSTPWTHRRVVDLPSLIMGAKGIITLGSSREMLIQLGLDADFEGRHSALADAEMNWKAYQKLELWEASKSR
jgi:DNA polymerase-3 subunit epsilon